MEAGYTSSEAVQLVLNCAMVSYARQIIDTIICTVIYKELPIYRQIIHPYKSCFDTNFFGRVHLFPHKQENMAMRTMMMRRTMTTRPPKMSIRMRMTTKSKKRQNTTMTTMKTSSYRQNVFSDNVISFLGLYGLGSDFVIYFLGLNNCEPNFYFVSAKSEEDYLFMYI